MNPYSFKRFLQSSDQRRIPVVFSEDNNRLLIQGDLPDCVQNQSTNLTTLPTRLDLSFMGLEASESELEGSPGGDTTYPGPQDLPAGFPDLQPRSDHHLAQASLPDVYPASVVDDLQRQLSTQHRSIAQNALSTLPDFITNLQSPSRSTEVPVHASDHFLTSPKRSSSWIVRPRSRETIRRRTYSCDHLSSLLDLNVNRVSSTRMSPTLFATSVPPPSSSMAFSGLQNGRFQPYLPCVEEQQRRINLLLQRQADLEERLEQMRTLLNDRELLLSSVRAECEVVERQAELRIKALEHQLAEEKFRSAQDRWAVVQLRSMLSQLSVNPPTSTHTSWADTYPMNSDASRLLGNVFQPESTSNTDNVWTSTNVDSLLCNLVAGNGRRTGTDSQLQMFD